MPPSLLPPPLHLHPPRCSWHIHAPAPILAAVPLLSPPFPLEHFTVSDRHCQRFTHRIKSRLNRFLPDGTGTPSPRPLNLLSLPFPSLPLPSLAPSPPLADRSRHPFPISGGLPTTPSLPIPTTPPSPPRAWVLCACGVGGRRAGWKDRLCVRGVCGSGFVRQSSCGLCSVGHRHTHTSLIAPTPSLLFPPLPFPYIPTWPSRTCLPACLLLLRPLLSPTAAGAPGRGR